MLKIQDVADKVEALLEGKLELQEFEDWSATASWNIHKRTVNRRLHSLLYEIRSILNDHEDDDVAIRNALAKAVRGSHRAAAVADRSPQSAHGKVRPFVQSATSSVLSINIGHLGASDSFLASSGPQIVELRA